MAYGGDGRGECPTQCKKRGLIVREWKCPGGNMSIRKYPDPVAKIDRRPHHCSDRLYILDFATNPFIDIWRAALPIQAIAMCKRSFHREMHAYIHTYIHHRPKYCKSNIESSTQWSKRASWDAMHSADYTPSQNVRLSILHTPVFWNILIDRLTDDRRNCDDIRRT